MLEDVEWRFWATARTVFALWLGREEDEDACEGERVSLSAMVAVIRLTVE